MNCASSVATNEVTCRAYVTKLSQQKSSNYLTLSRFEIEITNPGSDIEIIIPVKSQMAKYTVNMYLAQM